MKTNTWRASTKDGLHAGDYMEGTAQGGKTMSIHDICTSEIIRDASLAPEQWINYINVESAFCLWMQNFIYSIPACAHEPCHLSTL